MLLVCSVINQALMLKILQNCAICNCCIYCKVYYYRATNNALLDTYGYISYPKPLVMDFTVMAELRNTSE